jgi:hypothetical protein
MAKEIVPNKLIVNFNKEGTFENGVLQYQIKVDGVTDSKYYTIGIKDGIKIPDIDKILSDSKAHAEKGEKIK